MRKHVIHFKTLKAKKIFDDLVAESSTEERIWEDVVEVKVRDYRFHLSRIC